MPKIWQPGTDDKDWVAVYNGSGTVRFDPFEGIYLMPKSATTPGETYACLVLDKRSADHPLRDFRATVVVTINRQLRTPAANPWEAFWLVFNYQGDSPAGKTANYFILKTNGVELGRMFGQTGQHFLKTAASPALLIGQPYLITVEKRGRHFAAAVNGHPVLTFEGDLYDGPGAVGLYTEDADVTVHFTRIEHL